MVSEDVSNIHAINSFTTTNFINYALAANQGDYFIISNKILGTGAKSRLMNTGNTEAVPQVVLTMQKFMI